MGIVFSFLLLLVLLLFLLGIAFVFSVATGIIKKNNLMSNTSPTPPSDPNNLSQDEVTAHYAERESWIRTSVSFKMFAVAFLALILLIPAFMIQWVIQDRQYRRDEAVAEISSKWGIAQTVSGPVLIVPYLEQVKDEEGKISLVEHVAHFLPEQLDIKTDLAPELRYRGIYEAVLYTASTNISGQFSFPNFADWGINSQNVLWDKAILAVGIPDMRGIKDKITLKWNNQNYTFEPGVELGNLLGAGVSTRPTLLTSGKADTTQTFRFQLELHLNGSETFQMLPLGKETTIAMSSNWSNPSFEGAFLPDERNISEQGFNAQWKILHLNRNYPQQWRGNSQDIFSSAFGVKLLTPIDEYQKTTRSSKYAVMFIFLTFLGFFFAEVLNRMRIHPLQYLLVGAALCLFYLLLISLSEHIKFNPAYLVSAVAIIIMITAYSSTIFHSRKLTLTVFVTLTALYGFLYSLLQLQDYALLLGSLGLFLILAAAMYLSRNVDWYNIGKK